MISFDQLNVPNSVGLALEEDIGRGDITGLLVPEAQQARAQIISRQPAVICGIPWVMEVFNQLDARVALHWQVQDGDAVSPNQILCILSGSARALLAGERCALNFLQTLSGTATTVQKYVKILSGTTVKLLDTRKTIPGLRVAQKYAVTCGGGYNHRIGLFDAFLIKENHIMACGSITQTIKTAKQHYPNLSIEVEAENLGELQEAIIAGADIVLLDNFDLATLRQAALLNKGKVKLEASGGIMLDNLRAVAETGIDYISIGSLTKHIHAIDLSMRFVEESNG